MTWNFDMSKAPRDGTMLLLVIDVSDPEFDDNSHLLEDTEKYSRTVGHNNFTNDGEDEWQMAGWCWSHDHYTSGHGKPVAWMLFPTIPHDEQF